MPVVQSDSLEALTRTTSAEVAPTITTSVSAERIARQMEALGPLPAVALEVMQLTEDPNSDAKDLQQSISRDAVIAGKVLRMANSAYFSSGTPCQTLQQASTRLGMKMIRNLVVSSCVTGMMDRDLPNYPYHSFGLQKHSLATGLITGEIVTRLGLPRTLIDELFLDGLLHDVGKLVLNPLLPSRVIATGITGIERERLLTGTDHAAVGILMAEHWKLPAHAVAVIGHHHDVTGVDEDFRAHAAVVGICDWLLNMRRIGLADDAQDVAPHPDDSALDALEIDQERLTEFTSDIDDALVTILEFCDAAI
ncbi:MAG: HDOD domain-containing protein [Pseudomonadota bacterium]